MTNTPRLGLPEPQPTDLMTITPPAFATIWSNVDGAIGPTICTSSTKPATPYACQWIYLTDTGAEQIWDPIASAWITIKTNPTGIIAVNSQSNQTTIAAAATEYQIQTINAMAIEPYKNYKVHVEGIAGYNFDGTHQTALGTQTGQVFLRYSNASTVNLTGTLFAAMLADPMQSGLGATTTVKAQQMFSFDGIYIGNSSSQLSVCWSYEMAGTFNANSSSYYAKNTIMYVERI